MFFFVYLSEKVIAGNNLALVLQLFNEPCNKSYNKLKW